MNIYTERNLATYTVALFLWSCRPQAKAPVTAAQIAAWGFAPLPRVCAEKIGGWPEDDVR